MTSLVSLAAFTWVCNCYQAARRKHVGTFLLGMCRWPLIEPLPHHIVWSIIDSILVTFRQLICNFRDPNLVTFYLSIYLILNKKKTIYIFTHRANILVLLLAVNMKNCLTPKIKKMCYPILATLLKMRPYDSQFSRENATPASGTSPLASNKQVPRPGPSRSMKRSRSH